MKIIFIADFFVENGINGGGELNNEVFCDLVTNSDHKLLKVDSKKVDISFLKNNSDCKFVIANFVFLKSETIEYISSNLDYVIYEHDHKYVRTRNPASYENYIAPKSEIVNFHFYKNALAVFCQSNFHKDIVEKNLELDNIISLGGNLWSDDSLELMRTLSKKEKKEKFSIMESDNWHKNTAEAIRFCVAKEFDYELIPSCSYEEFLNKLSENKKFVFLPKTPETLSRIVVEARMMGMSVVTNNKIGATKEKWFKLKGEELIELMYDKKQEILDKVIGVFSEDSSSIK
jgi:hypothetical protein